MSTIYTHDYNELTGFRLDETRTVFNKQLTVKNINTQVFMKGIVLVQFAPPMGSAQRVYFSLPYVDGSNYINFYYVEGLINIFTNTESWANGSCNFKVGIILE